MPPASDLSANEAMEQLLVPIKQRLLCVEEENDQLRQRLDHIDAALEITRPHALSRLRDGSTMSDLPTSSSKLPQAMLQIDTAGSSSAGRSTESRLESARLGGLNLGEEYLLFNQVAYAIAALPIGTVLSIAPLFLKNELDVPVSTIGYMMMSGELLGILFMKWAELSFEGFVFKRPHDVHFILFSVAACLFVIPLWPSKLWAGAAAAMMLVQAFNSASKPVVAESVYRLAVLMGRDPSIVFAKANKWRRIGNAIVGASTPLAYMVSPYVAFFVSSPILAIFTFGMYRCKKNIDLVVESVESLKRQLKVGYEASPYQFRLLASPPSPVSTAMRMLTSKTSGGNNVMSMQNTGSAHSTSTTIGKIARLTRILGTESLETTAVGAGILEAKSSWFLLLLFLTVHVFPFMDAFISRLPFAFLTIAICEQSGTLWVACVVLFSYQSCRAIGQSIQTYGVNNAVNYVLTCVSVVAYALVLLCVVVYPDFHLWFLPMIPTGLSETLPVQQFYLGRLLRTSVDGSHSSARELMREYVKKSHTGTGIGSAAAFFTSAFLYAKFGLFGIGLLGEAVAVTKLALVIFIGSSLSAGSAQNLKSERFSPEPEKVSDAAPPEQSMSSLPSISADDDDFEQMLSI